MQRRGRLAAERLNAPYPEELESAVLAYVRLELARAGEGNVSAGSTSRSAPLPCAVGRSYC